MGGGEGEHSFPDWFTAGGRRDIATTYLEGRVAGENLQKEPDLGQERRQDGHEPFPGGEPATT